MATAELVAVKYSLVLTLVSVVTLESDIASAIVYRDDFAVMCVIEAIGSSMLDWKYCFELCL